MEGLVKEICAIFTPVKELGSASELVDEQFGEYPWANDVEHRDDLYASAIRLATEKS